jgi:hypothetical protein
MIHSAIQSKQGIVVKKKWIPWKRVDSSPDSLASHFPFHLIGLSLL